MTTVWALALLWLSAGLASSADDLDGDGLADELEQRLMEQFLPRFRLPPGECAQLPAAFRAGSLTPRVEEHNGTLYAQVFASAALGSESPALELHYYHLWDRDCGRLSPHPLDVEHVSALLVEGPEGWTAKYWYAAAHEDTLCDASHAARSQAIAATTRGPEVWISAGKHASFLAPELCRKRGCGVDDCEEGVALPDGAVINLGERHRPLNGAVWTASAAWPLDDKLEADFTPRLVAELEASDEPLLERVHGDWRPVQFSLSVGGDVVGALGTATRQGGEGVAVAEQETQGAVSRALRAVGRAILRTAQALRLVGDSEP